jgi:FkbM family methyltransferase
VTLGKEQHMEGPQEMYVGTGCSRWSAPLAQAGSIGLRAVVHAMLAIPPAWCVFERSLVVARHRAPNSRMLAALAAQWLYAMRRWRPEELSRIATLPGGGRLAIMLTDGWHRGIYFRGEYEPETTALLRRFLRPGDTVVDLGANIGYYSCLAAAHGARVHAFEPNPAMVERLTCTRDVNGYGSRLTINPVAVAAKEGMAEFHLSPQPENTGLSSLLPLPHLVGGELLQVPTITLDSYCDSREIRHIRLLKIDVEGAELQVLAGAGRVLSEVRPDAIICEMGGFADGSQPGHVFRRLMAAGYIPHEITIHGLAPLTCDPDSIDAQTWPQRNICFLRPDAEPGRVSVEEPGSGSAAAETPAPKQHARPVSLGRSR